MESHYGVGINNRYALFLDQDDLDDEVMLQKAAETAKKSKETQKVNGVPPPAPAPKKDTKPTPAPQTTAPTSKKPEGGKPLKGEDKENRSNRFDGKRVLDARKAQEGPREPRSREERNNRRNRGPNEEEGSQANPNAPSAGGFGSETQPQRYGGEGRRGGRGGGRGGGQGGERRGDRVERGDRGERPDRGDRGDRGERRGGEGGGRGGPRTGGKRDFDRKSGDDRTGVKAVDKREGGGSHNWGTFEDEMKADDDKVNTSTDDALNETAASGDNGEAMHTESGGEENREPEEPKVMTLDEWKKQQGERSGPKFNLRKAGEGSEIDPKWKKTVAYKKEKETHEDDEDEEHELYPQRVNRQKRLMDIEINFADSSRGGPGGAPGGRGGRGGPRGGRGGDRPPRGGPREPRGEPREPREPRGEGERGDRGEPRPERGEPRAERGGDRPPRGERRGGRGGERGGPPSGGKGRGRSHAEAPNVNDELSFPSLG